MPYETKALLIAIGSIMRMADGDMEKAYNVVAKMANAEGVVLEPYRTEAKAAPERED